jgi:hypothetical protein
LVSKRIVAKVVFEKEFVLYINGMHVIMSRGPIKVLIQAPDFALGHQGTKNS